MVVEYFVKFHIFEPETHITYNIYIRPTSLFWT